VSVRTELAAALTEALPDVVVIDHDANPTIARTTVMVYVEKVDRATTRGQRTYTLALAVIVPVDDEARLEDALEDVLEGVDLWRHPAVWETAERAVWGDTYPAFKVTVTGQYQHTYPELEES
jgi:hypothetical protein